MKCGDCGGPHTAGQATRDQPYAYTESGLPHLQLVGIGTVVCGPCRITVAVIPRIQELHAVIAHTLSRKPTRLAGPEIQFLRKHARVSLPQFAAFLGVAPAEFTGRRQAQIADRADRLVRVLVTVFGHADGVEDALHQLAADLTTPRRSLSVVFLFTQNRWEVTA